MLNAIYDSVKTLPTDRAVWGKMIPYVQERKRKGLLDIWCDTGTELKEIKTESLLVLVHSQVL